MELEVQGFYKMLTVFLFREKPIFVRLVCVLCMGNNTLLARVGNGCTRRRVMSSSTVVGVTEILFTPDKTAVLQIFHVFFSFNIDLRLTTISP